MKDDMITTLTNAHDAAYCIPMGMTVVRLVERKSAHASMKLEPVVAIYEAHASEYYEAPGVKAPCRCLIEVGASSPADRMTVSMVKSLAASGDKSIAILRSMELIESGKTEMEFIG